MIRRTLRWLAALCALALIGGGAAAWYWGSRADAMTRDAVAKAFSDLAPNARVTLAAASFDWEETVTVTDLTVADRAGGAPSIVVPELRLTLDRERFREAERVEVRALTLVRPTLTLIRRPDGNWNLADLLPLNPPVPAPACPAWEIEDATVRLLFGDAAGPDGFDPGRGPLAVTLHGLNVTLLPDSRRSYRVRGTGGVAGGDNAIGESSGGGVAFDGAIDLDRGVWRLAGKMGGLELGGGLLADAAVSSPELQAGLLAAREKFEEAERKIAGEPVPPGRGPVMVASADPFAPVRSGAGAIPRGPVRLTDFGLEGDLSAEFSFSAGSFTQTPEYDVTVACRAGTLVNRFLPFPLSGVRGAARIVDGEVRLLHASGRHGETHARAEGVFRPSPLGVEGRVTLSAERVPVTAADGPRLPDTLRKLHTILGPTGTADVAVATLETEPSVEDGELRNRWELRELDVTVSDGTARPEKFPYPVRNLTGTAKTDEEGVLRLDFRGTVAGRPGAFGGWVRNPGKRCEFRGAAKAVGVPLDETFRDACPPPVRASVEHMALTGTADGALTLHRPAGLDQPVRWTLDATVADGSVRPASFPYAIESLSGGVRFDSDEGVWRFENLRGAHGPARLTGEAAFNMTRAPGRLDLDVTAVGAPLDRAARAALPEGPRVVWDLLDVSAGTVDLRASVGWAPGRPVRVDLPDVRLTGGAFRPECFPLALTDVNASGAYESGAESGAGALRVDSFAYEHADLGEGGRVSLRTTGRGEVRHRGDGAWALSLDDLACDGLVIGPDLRAALSDGLRDAAEALNLRGPIDLRAPSLQFKGVSDGSAETTAAWWAVALLNGNVAELGPTVTLGRGAVTCEGSYDGVRTRLDGTLRTDRAELLDHMLADVTAPYRLVDNLLSVGDLSDPNGTRLTADAYGGVLRVAALADLSRGPDYRLAAELNGAKLGTYAARQMGGARNLEGNVRGRLSLSGSGADLGAVTGNGEVEVKPAALGELNVVMRLFKAVNMNDPTMFHSAAAQFDLADETAVFRRIDLLGEAISFVGRGRVFLSGGLDLQFYSKPPTTWRMPLVRALSTGWVGVQVGGTISHPAVRTFSPAVQGSLQAFLTPLSPLLREPVPRRTAGGR